jgi:hypothetical protein
MVGKSEAKNVLPHIRAVGAGDGEGGGGLASFYVPRCKYSHETVLLFGDALRAEMSEIPFRCRQFPWIVYDILGHSQWFIRTHYIWCTVMQRSCITIIPIMLSNLQTRHKSVLN